MNMQKEVGVGVLRVSTQKQGLTGDSPDNQRELIERFAKKNNIQMLDYIELWESARKDIQPIDIAIQKSKHLRGKFTCFVFTYMDRITRAGVEAYIQSQNKLKDLGLKIYDIDGIITNKTVNTMESYGCEYSWSSKSLSLINELIESEKSKQDVTSQLTKMLGAEVRYTRMGYAVGNPSPGYSHQSLLTEHGYRKILIKDLKTYMFYELMYKLLDEGKLSKTQIVEYINDQGYVSPIRQKRSKTELGKIIGRVGGRKLTLKDLNRITANPIYAGIKYSERQMLAGKDHSQKNKGKAVKLLGDSIIDIETWNRVNTGRKKIVNVKALPGEEVIVLFGKQAEGRVVKNKDNPNYPFKKYILCPICKNELKGSASTNRKKVAYGGYHCSRNHKYFRIPLTKFNNELRSFIKKVHFSKKFIDRLKEEVVNQWHERHIDSIESQKRTNERIKQINDEMILITKKVLVLDQPQMIQILQDQVEGLTKEKLLLEQKSNSEIRHELNVQKVINNLYYLVEHIDEIVFNKEKPLTGAAFLGNIFDETPTYHQIIRGTPRLSPLFELNEEFKKSNSMIVGNDGLEPSTSE